MTARTDAFNTEFTGEPPGFAKWRKTIVGEFPYEFREHLRRNHIHIVNKSTYAEANRELVRLQKRLALPGTNLKASSTREQVEQWAEQFTKRIEMEFGAIGRAEGVIDAARWLQYECRQRGQEIPLPAPMDELFVIATNGSEEERRDAKAALFAGIARVLDPRWWLRRISREQSRIMEQTARLLRMVSVYESPYCSLYTLRNRESQKRRNTDMLDGMEAVNTLTGDAVNLLDCVNASVSNPVNRRHELMVRMRGFEDVANLYGHVGMFYTITCPSKYHPALSRKNARNPKYNGASPRDAQGYLVSLWARIRAALHRRDIRVYGFRVAEPHHDGTPHWHMLLFVHPEQEAQATAIMRHYALEEDRSEAGADKYRFEAVRIDPDKGSATGYIAKYIAKNIDGAMIDHDEEANLPGIEGAMRVEAWASCWGIRQFQPIGGPSVTVWRELRRLSLDEVDEYAERMEKLAGQSLEAYTDIFGETPEGYQLRQVGFDSWDAAYRVRKLWEDADSADWAAYVMHQGGPLIPRANQALRAEHRETNEENSYGEKIKRLIGVTTGAVRGIVTRAASWFIRRCSSNERSEAQSDAAASPWSSVNNCTEPVPRPPDAADRELIRLDFMRGSGVVAA